VRIKKRKDTPPICRSEKRVLGKGNFCIIFKDRIQDIPNRKGTSKRTANKAPIFGVTKRVRIVPKINPTKKMIKK